MRAGREDIRDIATRYPRPIRAAEASCTDRHDTPGTDQTNGPRGRFYSTPVVGLRRERLSSTTTATPHETAHTAPTANAVHAA